MVKEKKTKPQKRYNNKKEGYEDTHTISNANAVVKRNYNTDNNNDTTRYNKLN